MSTGAGGIGGTGGTQPMDLGPDVPKKPKQKGKAEKTAGEVISQKAKESGRAAKKRKVEKEEALTQPTASTDETPNSLLQKLPEELQTLTASLGSLKDTIATRRTAKDLKKTTGINNEIVNKVLRKCNYRFDDIRDEHMKNMMRAHCREVTELHIDPEQAVSAADIENLAAIFPYVTTLKLGERYSRKNDNEYSNVHPSELPKIKKFTNLHTLILPHAPDKNLFKNFSQQNLNIKNLILPSKLVGQNWTAALEFLNSCENLQTLDLTDAAIWEDSAFSDLANLKQLGNIKYISCGFVDPNELENLKVLIKSHNNFFENKPFSKQKLVLNLHFRYLADQIFQFLMYSREYPNVTIRLPESVQITGDNLEQFAPLNLNIKHLHISPWPRGHNLKPQQLKMFLDSWEHLRSIRLGEDDITDEILDALSKSKSLGKIIQLDLSQCRHITDNEIKKIAQALKDSDSQIELDLWLTHITEESLKELISMKTVPLLNLGGSLKRKWDELVEKRIGSKR